MPGTGWHVSSVPNPDSKARSAALLDDGVSACALDDRHDLGPLGRWPAYQSRPPGSSMASEKTVSWRSPDPAGHTEWIRLSIGGRKMTPCARSLRSFILSAAIVPL